MLGGADPRVTLKLHAPMLVEPILLVLFCNASVELAAPVTSGTSETKTLRQLVQMQQTGSLQTAFSTRCVKEIDSCVTLRR